MNNQQNDPESVLDENETEIEEIEGQEDDEIHTEGLGAIITLDKKYIHQSTLSVHQVVERINKNRFILDPNFQRPEIWRKYKQSKLIESCLMHIPIPQFHVATNQNGEFTIIDGLQRLSSFRDYLNNGFKLKFRPIDSEISRNVLDGKKFEDLEDKLQERIQDTSLTFNIIDEAAPQEFIFDIFDRANSGVPLTRQQMRNALFCGPAADWLTLIVGTNEFKNATRKSLNSQTMRDREAVNRFVSFKLIGWTEYKGDMDKFLADGLTILREYKDSEFEELKKNFIDTMQFCAHIFGGHCFRRSLFNMNMKKSQLNMSLFDVMSVTFSDNIEKLKKIDVNKLKDNIFNLESNSNFEKSITKGTNSKNAVICRYKTFENLIGELV